EDSLDDEGFPRSPLQSIDEPRQRRRRSMPRPRDRLIDTSEPPRSESLDSRNVCDAERASQSNRDRWLDWNDLPACAGPGASFARDSLTACDRAGDLLFQLVGARGFEPLTSSVSGKIVAFPPPGVLAESGRTCAIE